MKTDLEIMVGEQEQVYWKGKPKFSCFLLEAIFNPLLPFALIWALIDFTILGLTVFSGDTRIILIVLLFFSVHLMPVWIYLGGVIGSVLKYKHTQYIVTDKGVYISKGAFSRTSEMRFYRDIPNVYTHQGFFDQRLQVGDVVLGESNEKFAICDVPDYRYVYQVVKRFQEEAMAAKTANTSKYMAQESEQQMPQQMQQPQEQVTYTAYDNINQ